MTSTNLGNCTAILNGTNITFSGTYTATFSPTAVKLGVDYLVTLVVRYTSSRGTVKLRVAQPNVTATSLNVTAPFTATMSQCSLTPSSGGNTTTAAAELKYNPTCELFVELVLDLQNNSETFLGVNASAAAVATPSAAEPPAVDTTDDLKGTITSYDENAPNEGKERAFDNQIGSKWLGFAAQNWIQYSYAAGIAGRLTSYTLTSGNDSPERDPTDFRLMGSNDGQTFTTVETRTGVTFSARLQKQTFTLGTPSTFNTYRLVINKVAGGQSTMVQLTEIELLGQQVSSP